MSIPLGAILLDLESERYDGHLGREQRILAELTDKLGTHKMRALRQEATALTVAMTQEEARAEAKLKASAASKKGAAARYAKHDTQDKCIAAFLKAFAAGEHTTHTSFANAYATEPGEPKNALADFVAPARRIQKYLNRLHPTR